MSLAGLLQPEGSSAQTPQHLPAPPPRIPDAIPLDLLAPGRRAVIVSLKDEFAYLYLLRLGLVVGAEVELVRAISRGSIRVFRVDSGELALRSDAASGISVRLLTAEEQRSSAE